MALTNNQKCDLVTRALDYFQNTSNPADKRLQVLSDLVQSFSVGMSGQVGIARLQRVRDTVGDE